MSAVAHRIAGDAGMAVTPGARLPTLDILRGFALLGMILAHFHKTMGQGAASFVGTIVSMGVAEKDRAVFAFLFGVGFAMMIRRLEAKGLPVGIVYLRRLMVLYGLGFAVEALTRFPILRDYAWWGVPLLFLRQYSTRSLLAFAFICAAALSIRIAADSGYAIVTRGYQATVAAERAEVQQWEAVQRADREATSLPVYSKVVQARIRQMIRDLPTLRQITPGAYLALFVIGLLAVRHGIFDQPKRHLAVIGGAMGFGLVCWVAHWWLLPGLPPDIAPPRVMAQLRSGFGVIDEQFLAFTYIGAITLLLVCQPGWQHLFAPFACAGRMALTNYLVQAMTIDVASAPYGLGLKIGPAAEILAGIALFGVQALLSQFWLSRYRFGPFEWLWRSVTYWSWQPFRCAADPSAHGRPRSGQPLPTGFGEGGKGD